ncbi:MAG: CapA family protein [Bacteroides sp.]|nr:CapA family protein [Bacteroides sp.]
MKVIIAGDFAPRARLAKQIENKRFGEIFPDKLVKIIKSADYSLVNFESPVIEDGFEPIEKCGPSLGCSSNAVDAIKYAGFTAVTMANNHILDYGSNGLSKSVECCKNSGLDVVGVGNNLQDAEKILYVKKNEKILAVINCCEHEFSIATSTTSGANPLNPIRQYYSIQEARKNADYVLIIVHGGHEHYQLPSPRMQEIYRFFIDAGADVVVNHHQHCYSGYEIYNSKLIFYGLGNFCFDWEGAQDKKWTEGYFIMVDFNSILSFKIYPYCQYGIEANIKILNEDNLTIEIEKLNNIIYDNKLLNLAMDSYLKESTKDLKNIFSPIRNRYINYVWRKLFPPFLSNKSRLFILAHLQCESHIVKVLYKLRMK